MPFGLREDRRRRRRRLHWALFKWAVALALVGAAGIYAYETGRRLASADITRLEETIATLRTQLDASEAANAGERAAAETAQAMARDWQARYDRDVARGPSKDIFDIVQQKLAAGVEPERLKAVLRRHPEPPRMPTRGGAPPVSGAGADAERDPIVP